MEFCILSPVAGLERYSTLSRHHLLLPHIRLAGYWEFYKQRSKAGDHIILDNSAYEGSLDTTRLLECIHLINPNVVALPDHLGKSWEHTWRDSDAFLDSYFYEFPHIQWMYIPQSEPGNIIGFVEGLFRALDDERIAWIGLPRALTYSITNDLTMRVRVAEQIRKRSSVKIHALGMAKGSVEEVRLLRNSGCVTSIDSNAPVWRGWCGYDLFQFGMSSHVGRWLEVPVNYEAPEKDLKEELDTLIVMGKYRSFQRNGESRHQTKHELILENLEAVGVNTNV